MFSTFVLVLTALPFAMAEEADPHIWLEDVEGEKALDWVREKNEVSVAEISQAPGFEDLQNRLLETYDSEDRIPYVSKLGEHYYNFWRDGNHERGIWRRTSLEEYQKEVPVWDVVLDLDDISESEGENWVWKGAECLRPEYTACLLRLSRGGADATVVREFDLESRNFVAEGFVLPEAKSRVSWIDADTVLVGTDFGEGSLTDSGYPRVVKRWSRGTPLDSAEPFYEGEASDVAAGAWHDQTPGFERTFAYRATTFWTDEYYYLGKKGLVQIEKPDDADARVYRKGLFFETRSDWTLDGTTYAAGSLLVTDFKRWMKGKRDVEVLFTPEERTSLRGVTYTRNHVVLTLLDNVRSRLVVLTPGKKGWATSSIEGLPEQGSIRVWEEDSDSSDAYFLQFSDYVTPSTLARGVIGEGEAETLKQLPPFFDATGLVISQHEAVSADGTRIPYFQVAREDMELDGTTPTLLYGYGGFEVSLLPGYRASVGISWLEKGGVYAVANIRGGGEFGPRWHQAALKEKRPRAYEDFIAVGEDLVNRGVTAVPHLGIAGGSNGGLLVGNMLTMRPDLWGAVLCQVPLLDMRRYHTLLAGASWVAEYGNPDNPEEWAFIEGFSPYHNIDPAAAYPRTLITTSTRDDRVHPGHARKMTARLLEHDKHVLYYENIEGGHGGAANNAQAAFMDALGYSFLWQTLAPQEAGDEAVEESP